MSSLTSWERTVQAAPSKKKSHEREREREEERVRTRKKKETEKEEEKGKEEKKKEEKMERAVLKVFFEYTSPPDTSPRIAPSSDVARE